MSNNVGDALNHFLIRRLSGREVSFSHRDKPHYIVCGSILSESNDKSTVWGAGFNWWHHSKKDINESAKIISVRGELSADRCGKSVDAVGDPALLLPLFVHPKVYSGSPPAIIPHWSNIEGTVEKYPHMKIISPMLPLQDFVDEVYSSPYVFSESLHGLIIADAFGTKNAWVDLGGDTGDGFKYADYYSTTSFPDTEKIVELNPTACIVHKYKYDLFNLLNCCPFGVTK